MNKSFKVGDLIEVVRNDNKKFRCIVVESYDGEGFVGKVITKDEGIGTADWVRYGLNNDGRFQLIEDCKTIKVIAESNKVTATSTLSLQEGVHEKDDLTYYETPIGDGEFSTFCVCNGYGGWSFHDEKSKINALKESFFNSQISKSNNLRSE